MCRKRTFFAMSRGSSFMNNQCEPGCQLLATEASRFLEIRHRTGNPPNLHQTLNTSRQPSSFVRFAFIGEARRGLANTSAKAHDS